MGLRELIGNLLEKFDGPAPMPEMRVIEDPFNYVLALSLATSTSNNVLQQLMTKVPALSKGEAEGLIEKCDVLIHEAIALYYQVQKESLSEEAAEIRIKQTCPEIDQPNFSLLRARAHMFTSK